VWQQQERTGTRKKDITGFTHFAGRHDGWLGVVLSCLMVAGFFECDHARVMQKKFDELHKQVKRGN
jgi:hypothetical protein